ncbi:Ig-like domain-containing protein [Pseudomonas fluorescens]|uniref:Tc toxin subunit A-related protein n=1 Tax=Pseudomonas fluorescens TaxID=294 RepID=UPI001432018E|nr:neuraminidase-like domain-containing protein [Pseudomonas fluorescens]
MNSGIINEIEEQRRDALVAYYLGQIVPSSNTAAPLRLTTPEDLYEYLLIDNQVSAQVDTSRVAQAIASLQQYIHAIYNGMEPGYPYGFSAEELRSWRESMSQYSVWAGYQMIEDYPENYIDPSLRQGKTSQFKTFENNLGQSRLTDDSVQIALKNYLSQFELVSNLKIISGYINGTDFRQADYYFVGRQNVEPFGVFWRKAAIDLDESSTHISPAAWSEWKTIDVAFDAGVAQVRLVEVGERLHVVWVEVGQPKVSDNGSRTGQYSYSAKMAYKQLNDQWSPATVLFTELTSVNNLPDKLAADIYIRSGAFSVAVDLRVASNPRLVVAFQLGDHKDLRVYDELFNRVFLDDAEEAELSRIASSMFGGDPARLQFPYVGIDTGATDIEWQLDSVVWDRNHPGNYYPPSTTYPDALNPYLELRAVLHMQQSGPGGRLEVQGSCQAIRMERVDVKLSLQDRYVWDLVTSVGGLKYRMEVYFHIFYEGGKPRALLDMIGNYAYFHDKTNHRHIFTYADKTVGTINQNTPFTQIGASWDSSFHGGRVCKMRFKIPLSLDVDELLDFTPEEIQRGAFFKVASRLELRWGGGPVEQTLSFINKSNVFSEIIAPVTRDFTVWYGDYDSDNKYAEESLGSAPLTLNGAAKTPVFRKSWTGTTKASYLFLFGASRSVTPEIGCNVFEVRLNPRLRFVPKLTTTEAGAQFLDLEALELDNLRYVRLNSLFAGELVSKAEYSAQAVLSWEIQHTPEPPVPGSSEPVPLDFNGANGRYFWELFFHVPHLVAQRLHREFDYLSAETWYHAIFNPLARIQPLYPAPDADYPYWSVRPLAQPDRPAEQFFGLGGLRDPDAIAYSVPSHYRKAIFTGYLKNLIDRGDMLYRQLTRDALNEAKLLYVRALSLLGPLSKGRSISRWEPMTLKEVAAYDSELFSEFESSTQGLFTYDIPRHIQGEPWMRLIDAPWFRLPVNTQLLDLWSSLDLRLSNLRNNLTLDGKPLLLALYEAPANPSDLLRAQLTGESGGARRLGSLADIPPYRFRAMLPRVQNVVETLIRFGEQVRTFMELRDRAQQEELLQSHVQELSKFGVTLQKEAVDQAGKSKAALGASKTMVTSRQRYYERLRKEDVSPEEKLALYERSVGGVLSAALTAGTTAAQVIDAYHVNVFGTSVGTRKPAATYFAALATTDGLAKGMLLHADFLTQTDQHRRRREEWDFQVGQAKAEIIVLDKQIEVQDVVIGSARTALRQAEKASDQAEVYYDFLKHRSTGPGLYQWLLSQMATLYFQAYDSVLSMCTATEACWQYELGDRNTRFIPHDAWADNRHGLNAGEALKLGLLRMESAFLHRHERRLELTKTISLKALLKNYDPNAGRENAPKTTGWPAVMAQLKSHGEIPFQLNSSLYDKDYPGHYRRQLVGVSLSFPVVLGPYQDIHATLVQTHSSTLLSASLGGVASLYSQAGELAPDSGIEPDPRDIVFNPRISQQVGLSSGLDDYGLFTLNFDDERYLPFEGTGAVSSWVLSFPRHASDKQQAIFDSLTDIILQVRYLAEDGGKAFAAQVESLVQFVEEQEPDDRFMVGTLAVSAGQKLANGEDFHTATVTVKDGSNRPVERARVLFPDIQYASLNPSFGYTNSQGLFETHITSTMSGSRRVRAMLADIEVAGSPKSVEFFVADSIQSELEMIKNNGVVSNTVKNNRVRATIRIGDGSLAPEGTLVTFDPLEDVDFSDDTCRTVGTTGQCEVTLGSTVAKTYRISARLEGAPSIMTVDATFIHSAYDAGASTLEPIEGTKVANGEDAHIATATRRDRYGNPVEWVAGAGDPEYVVFAAPATPTLVTIDPPQSYFVEGSATASTRITTEREGTYSILASLGQTQFATFVADPNPPQLDLDMTDDNGVVSDTARNNKVRVTVRLGNGSLAPEGTLVTFDPVEDVDFSDYTCRTVGTTGQCEVTLGSTVAKARRISARLEGASTSTSVDATFMHGAFNVAASTLEPIEGTKLADGADAHIATVTLRDAYGNPYTQTTTASYVLFPAVSGVTIDPTAPDRCGFVPGSATTTARITSEVEGNYSITVTSGNGAVIGQAQMATFVGVNADESHSTFSVSEDT